MSGITSKFKYLMFALLLCALGLTSWVVAVPGFINKPNSEELVKKQQIVLNEFLKPEIQNKLMRALLSKVMINGGGGSLYETYISSSNQKEPPQGMLDVPPKSNELIKLALYSSMEEFYQINPDCCYTKVVKNQEGCFKQIIERHPYRVEYICVYFKYKLRYLDENGVLKERDNNDYSAAMVDNEGKVIHWDSYYRKQIE